MLGQLCLVVIIVSVLEMPMLRVQGLLRRALVTLPMVAGRQLSSACRRLSFPDITVSKQLTEAVSNRADRCAQFIDCSPDPFHVVDSISTRLKVQGFRELPEDSAWSTRGLKAGDRYYFTRGGSSLIALSVGNKFTGLKSTTAIKILGAHTDSPNLKIKPKSKRGVASGMVQLNVECYGGGLWHTWFDRDLSLSGRVILRHATDPHRFQKCLVKIDQPILRIPNLCIHLRSAEERESFKVNKEEHLIPLLCGEVTRQLNATSSSAWQKHQEPLLVQVLAQQLGVEADRIVDFELSLFDTQPSSKFGLLSEFLCASRLDNLASCFVIQEALQDHVTEQDQGTVDDEDITIAAFFDHEEVGSESVVGAGSTLIADTIDRLVDVLYHSEQGSSSSRSSLIELKQVLCRRSLIISADMAHAVHPNYANKHEKNHAPQMNSGVVIKSNVNQRYATNGETGFLLRELARRADVPVQEFAVRNDCPCGSTIGPILSTRTGIRAIDIGMPQLSMHSIRETMGVLDLTLGYNLFREVLKNFGAVDRALNSLEE